MKKEYISPVGTDFTEHVKSLEDIEKFEKMCKHEKETIGVPLNKCIKHVVEALNLGRELKGESANVKLQGDISQN